MQKITLKTFVACLIAVITTAAHAQIVLHEATDVTQTKATLSADFPDLSVEHGFQYKYGTLPEIDEFSKIALATYSDPICLQTNNWHSVINKGYVETYSGQSGTITAKITLYQPSTVSFDWSIDAQDGCAYLRFCKDSGLGSSSFGGSNSISYVEISRISGDTPFTNYESYELSAGIHYLKWEYVQIKPSSVGLDIAKIKNISIQNTLSGDWNTLNANGSTLELTSLVPNSDVIYRAYSCSPEGTAKSFVKSFHTSSIEIEAVQIGELTQTTAKINRKVEYSETDLSKGINYMLIDSKISALVNENTDCTGISISANKWEVTNQGLQYIVTHESGFSYGILSLNFEIFGEKYTSYKIEFDVNNVSTYSSGCYCGLFVDGKKNVEKTFGKGKSHYIIELRPGVHTLQWKTQRWNTSAAGGTITISNLSIENIVSGTNFQTSYTTNDFTLLTGLSPNSTYSIQSFVIPSGALELPQAWQGERSDWFRIHTKAIEVSVECNDITQTTFTVIGNINRGDASSKGIGFQYKLASSDSWIDVLLNNEIAEFTQKVDRLKPANTYEVRAYAIYESGEYAFSNSVSVTTMPIVPQKPKIVFLSQHQANIQGEIIFGNASIYQRGMQFREKGVDAWTDVEDNGDGTLFTLIRKDLESGRTYEVRTYVQPVGCDIIYSDILEFTTLDNYFTGSLKSPRTQTTVEFSATLADVDESITVEEYGFEYYLDSDGFFENAESFIKSDVIRIPVTPENGQITTTVTGLTPYYGLRFRAYIKINGEYLYYTGSKNLTWNHAGTDRAAIKVSVKELTQTSVTLKLDATQDGDAVVSQIEYAFANSVQDTEEYQVCGNELTINNLTPDTKYNLRFRGTVNGRLCPLLLNIASDYSWYEFTTKAVTVSATFTNITQTKATMKVSVNAGDAEVTDLKYRQNYGEYTDCGETVNFNGLTPGTQYTIRFSGKVNGKDCYWETQPNTSNAYKFTTKTVSVSAHSSAIEQTSATISWSYNCGDATYVSSGIEYGTTTAMTESASNEDGEIRLTELTPNTTYHYCAYVETEEGGKEYSSRNSFSTSAISCATLPVSNISNRSATMNGTIDCDGYSSAEFGFQWKQMEGWNSDPAFTKGVKKEDGSISVALVNGMLEPNTDYQYRAAVRYKGNIYYASNWETFRTESEFVYYPASVYTIFATDRENNCLVLCGYYVAGSEDVVAQGYEYWNTSAPAHSNRTYAAVNNVIQITTDESMQYNLDLKTLVDGNYSVRAFVKTSSGATIYGETLAFGVQGGTITGIDNVETEGVSYSISNGILSIYNAADMSCTIYNLQGQIVECRQSMTDNEQFHLASRVVYIVRLSNGIVYKIRI